MDESKLTQTDPNATYYTDEPLFCGHCGRQTRKVLEIQGFKMVCFAESCFKPGMEEFFDKHPETDGMMCRLIISNAEVRMM